MEKKKLLLVAVSVGVFLVIVVSAAILIFSPPPGVASRGSGQQPDWFATGTAPEPAREDLDLEETITSLTDNRQETFINIYDDSGLTEAPAEPAGGGSVITVTPPVASGVPNTPAKPVEQPKPKPVAQPAPAKPAAPAAPAAAKKAYRDYWVQVGSFSSRERADGVKGTLDDKGLAAIITNQEIEGSTRYRVRVGPYTSQNEADYWLAMVKSIDGFQESQIWQSQSYR